MVRLSSKDALNCTMRPERSADQGRMYPVDVHLGRVDGELVAAR
jgi:hypothetical protein